MSLTAIFIAVILGSPPHLIDSRSTLERYDEAKIQVQGRDPFAGSGFCFPLLTVHGADDVGSVSFPATGFDDDHLRLLAQFPNLAQVRCKKVLTEAEHNLITSSVPTGTSLIYAVRSKDGSIDDRYRLSGYRVAEEDTNGDGVVDEDDIELVTSE